MTIDRELEAKRLSLVYGYPETTCLRAINLLGEKGADDLLKLANEYGMPTAKVEMALCYGA
jgi:hypothetical protein